MNTNRYSNNLRICNYILASKYILSYSHYLFSKLCNISISNIVTKLLPDIKIERCFHYIILCYITISCSYPKSEILQIGEAIEMNALEYKNEIIINNPLDIEIIDNNLFLFQSKGDKAAKILNINNGEITNSWGTRGNSSEEFIYPLSWGINKEKMTLYLYDLNCFILREYKYNNENLILINETPYKRKQNTLLHATVLDNNNIIASVIYGNEKPLLLLNEKLDSLCNFGEIPDINHKTIDLRTYSSILSSYKNTFVNVMADLGYIACHEQSKDGTIKKKWEHYLEKPIYKGNTLDRKLLKRGFVDVKMTQNYIFCVYSGKKWNSPNMDVQAETMLIFDHKGKLLKNYHLDKCIGKIAISDDEKTIYAVSLEPKISIVRFKITDI